MHLLYCKLSYREIGRRLGRHHTGISREITRDQRHISNYWDDPAQHRTIERRKQVRHTRKQSNKALQIYVLEKLQED